MVGIFKEARVQTDLICHSIWGTSYSITDYNNLTIAMWDGTEWTEVPSTATGTASSGSITTNNPVSDFSNNYFALGYVSPKKERALVVRRI